MACEKNFVKCYSHAAYAPYSKKRYMTAEMQQGMHGISKSTLSGTNCIDIPVISRSPITPPPPPLSSAAEHVPNPMTQATLCAASSITHTNKVSGLSQCLILKQIYMSLKGVTGHEPSSKSLSHSATTVVISRRRAKGTEYKTDMTTVGTLFTSRKDCPRSGCV